MELTRNPTSKDVIEPVKKIFARFGLPETIFSDGDPLYTSREFSNFCREYECSHDYSSAGYSRSNGQVERAIQHMKNIVAKCMNDNSEICHSLLAYYNTPLGDNLGSPAMILFNRKLRSKIPCICLGNEIDRRNRE